jgi:hypothetical protein
VASQVVGVAAPSQKVIFFEGAPGAEDEGAGADGLGLLSWANDGVPMLTVHTTATAAATTSRILRINFPRTEEAQP